MDQNELNHHNIADLLGTAYDGILLTQIDMAGNKYGLNWVYEIFNDIKIHANENKINKIILEDAQRRSRILIIHTRSAEGRWST